MRNASRVRAAGDLERAGRLYQRAVELDPNSAQAWAGLASTTSNIDEAIIGWSYALALEPKDETRSVLNACVTERIKQSRVQDVAALIAVGRRLAESGHWALAHHLFLHATELDSHNEDAWVWRAGVARTPDETVFCLKRVLELNPQNARAKAGLAWAAKRREAAASPDALEQAATAFEEGQRALREGDRARAHEGFQRATELDPRNTSAWFWRGSTAADVDDALDSMEQVLAIDPENGAARDAQWWLRVQSLRDRSASRSHPQPAPLTPPPNVTQSAPGRNLAVLIIVAFLLIGALIGGLVILLSAAWYMGYLGR
jgi:tetratricopeptide (TPR) repeat protein